MFQITAGGSSTPVSNGQYTATLTSVELKEGGSFSGQFRVWNFLVDVGGNLIEISGTSGTSNAAGFKAASWLTAIMGTELKIGEPFDPIGRKCLVTVKNNAKGYPRVEDVSQFSEPQQVLEGVPR